MADGYYPKYYQKKKRKDRMFLVVGWVVGILVIGIPLGAITYSFFPMSRNPKGLVDLAEQKEQLEVERDIDQATKTQAKVEETTAITPATKSTNLDEIRYVGSQPSVHVDIKGVTPDDSRDPHTIDDAQDVAAQQGTNSTGEPNSATGNSGTSTTDSDRFPRDDPGSGNPATERPAGSDSQSTATSTPEPKPAEATTPSTPTDKPKADDKPEPAEEPEPKPQEDVTPKGITVYKVFAGYYDTRDEAVSRKKDLSTLGFGGAVNEDVGSFSIYVSKFEDSEHAKELESKLKRNGFPDAFVVRGKT